MSDREGELARRTEMGPTHDTLCVPDLILKMEVQGWTLDFVDEEAYAPGFRLFVFGPTPPPRLETFKRILLPGEDASVPRPRGFRPFDMDE